MMKAEKGRVYLFGLEERKIKVGARHKVQECGRKNENCSINLGQQI